MTTHFFTCLMSPARTQLLRSLKVMVRSPSRLSIELGYTRGNLNLIPRTSADVFQPIGCQAGDTFLYDFDILQEEPELTDPRRLLDRRRSMRSGLPSCNIDFLPLHPFTVCSVYSIMMLPACCTQPDLSAVHSSCSQSSDSRGCCPRFWSGSLSHCAHAPGRYIRQTCF